MNPLKRFHPDSSYEIRRYRISLEYWRKRGTQEIVRSLAADQPQPLIVRGDGTVMQGNTRIKVLEERGYNVNALPRVPF